MMTEIYRQSSVKNHLAKTLQAIIPFIFLPFLLRYPHQPCLTLNRAKVHSSFENKIKTTFSTTIPLMRVV